MESIHYCRFHFINSLKFFCLIVQSLFNKDLSQAMALSQSNTADLVLENVSKLEAKLEELDSVQSGQQVLDDLGKELQEILDVLVNNFIKLTTNDFRFNRLISRIFFQKNQHRQALKTLSGMNMFKIKSKLLKNWHKNAMLNGNN